MFIEYNGDEIIILLVTMFLCYEIYYYLKCIETTTISQYIISPRKFDITFKKKIDNISIIIDAYQS